MTKSHDLNRKPEATQASGNKFLNISKETILRNNGNNYLFENFFNVLSAVFVAFLGRVAVYLLRTVESSGLLYAAGGNFNNRNQK